MIFDSDKPRVNISAPEPPIAREDKDTVVMACSAVGRPPLFTDIEWYHEKERIALGGRFQGGSVGAPTLTITPVKRQDAGSYTCRLRNDIGWGEQTTSVPLNVTCKSSNTCLYYVDYVMYCTVLALLSIP